MLRYVCCAEQQRRDAMLDTVHAFMLTPIRVWSTGLDGRLRRAAVSTASEAPETRKAGGLTGECRWAVAMSHQDSCARVECLPPRHCIELEEAKAMTQRAEELKEKEKQQALRRKEREKQLQQEKAQEEQAELERAEAAIARLEGRRHGGI